MIADCLMTGREYARSAKDIAAFFHISTRKVSQMVEAERRCGWPICATCDSENPGYYLATTKEEMLEYCERLKHRADEINKTRKACLQVADSLPREVIEE